MPSITVSIEWDWPEDSFWLNPSNLLLMLSEYCPNTAWEVVRVEAKKPVCVHDADKFYPEREDYDEIKRA